MDSVLFPNCGGQDEEVSSEKVIQSPGKERNVINEGIQDVTTQSLPCQFCPEVLVGVFKLNRHLKKVHKAKIQITCNLCGEKFKRNKELVKHFQEHNLAGAGKRNKSREKVKSKRKEDEKSRKSECPELGTTVKPEPGVGTTVLPCAETIDLDESPGWGDEDNDPQPETDPLLDDGWGDWDNFPAGSPTVIPDIPPIPSPLPVSSFENVPIETLSPMFSTSNGFLLGPEAEKEFNLRENSLVEDPSGKFQCGRCDLIFKSRQLAKIHSTFHTLKINVKFRCPSCNAEFESPDKYRGHMARNHSGKRRVPGKPIRKSRLTNRRPRRHPCKYCPHKSTTKQHLKDHMQQHTGKLYPCPECPKLFSTNHKLGHHISRVHLKDLGVQIKVESEENEHGEDIMLFLRDYEEASGSTSTGQAKSRPVFPSCPVCKNRFMNNLELEEHMVSHKIGRDSNCLVCSKVFSCKSSAMRHYRLTHDPVAKEKNYWCPKCDRSYGTFGDLRNHLRYHQRQGKYPCPVCDRKFNCSTHVTAHMRVHGAERKFLCPTCGKAFMQRPELTRHERVHLRQNNGLGAPTEERRPDPNKERPFLCPHCGKTYIHKKTLNIHLTTHPEYDGHVCYRCGREFPSKDSLEEHMSQHPPKDAGSCVCEVCGKDYPTPYSLSAHMERHAAEKLQCDQCGKMCKTKGDLKFHSYMHMTTKPFPCQFCDYRCRHPSLRLHHVLTAHFGPDGFQENDKHGKEKTFVCEICSEGFTNAACLTQHNYYHEDNRSVRCKKENCEELFHTKYDLQYHVKISHRKKFPCQDCNKEFPLRTTLDQHRRYTHTKETPFGCTFCEKRFKSKGDLTYHLALHTGEYKFACDVCGKKCITKGNMNAHMKTHASQHRCADCGINCVSANALKKHRCGEIPQSESEPGGPEESYRQCLFCPKRFPPIAFTDHMREHAEPGKSFVDTNPSQHEEDSAVPEEPNEPFEERSAGYSKEAYINHIDPLFQFLVPPSP